MVASIQYMKRQMKSVFLCQIQMADLLWKYARTQYQYLEDYNSTVHMHDKEGGGVDTGSGIWDYCY